MKKRIISLLIVCLLICALLPTAAFATETPTITAVNSQEQTVGTGYTTIDAAAAAAGVDGKVILSAGTFEFNGRQTIAVEGVDLIGAGRNNTFLVPSASYASGSDTNRKALLTVSAPGEVHIEGITVDGSRYGDTITASYSPDFIVVRINSGTVYMDDVMITGSPRTLLSVGMGGSNPSSATVSATNFYADAEPKTLLEASYADIDVVRGSFTMTSGNSNAFISTSDADGSLDVTAAGHFTFQDTTEIDKYICGTPKHIIESYNNISLSAAKATYASLIASNDAVTQSMMRYIYANQATAQDDYNGMKAVVQNMRSNIWCIAYWSKIQVYIDILNGTVQ